jgi:hypothetical protein
LGELVDASAQSGRHVDLRAAFGTTETRGINSFTDFGRCAVSSARWFAAATAALIERRLAVL